MNLFVMPRHKISLIIVWLLLLVNLAGCAIFTVDTMKNEELLPSAKVKATPAVQAITTDQLKDGIFVGIAMSGGGSRAANFTAAVLLHLERLGILQRATALSSVSGSSLPAAYYGLYGVQKGPQWSELALRDQFQKDFEERWIWRWFLPWNIAEYWTSNFNRSDIMKEVLDNNLFHKMKFGNMDPSGPRILINATNLADGNRFVFSQERFEKIKSRIDTYPVANAVMASSAFPGAFHDMTLTNYAVTKEGTYEHVIDGGPSDNLGVSTLLDMAASLYRQEQKPKGCLLIVVDSYPYPQTPAHIHELDTRNALDFIFDTNVATSSDALLMGRRLDMMWETLNIDVRTEQSITPFAENTGDDEIWPDPADDKLRAPCAVWHLSLQRLLAPDFGGDEVRNDEVQRQTIKEVAAVVNQIPTRYKLKGQSADGKTDLGSQALQDYLFKAAEYVIYKDADKKKTYLQRVCDWFTDKKVTDLNCTLAKGGDHADKEKAQSHR